MTTCKNIEENNEEELHKINKIEVSNKKEIETIPQELNDLKPKPPAKLCPRGIKNFTVCRQNDETGVSGGGIVIEGTVYATGQCVIHWLYPPPRGSVAVFDSIEDFIKVHIKPHPHNKTIITYEDGETVSCF